MVGLGDLPGGAAVSEAFGVSADGKVIVGEGYSAVGEEAFRWTMEGGMVGLGDLPGGHFESAASATSADGSVVVGSSYTDLGYEAFYWNANTNMVNLREMLIAGGATGLAGWQLIEASSISADGRTIVGWGHNPNGQTEGWIATVPEPSTVYLAICGSMLLVAAARRRGHLRKNSIAEWCCRNRSVTACSRCVSVADIENDFMPGSVGSLRLLITC